MAGDKRSELARAEAKSLVEKLRQSNERAAKKGGERVPEARYKSLQAALTRKFARL
jgi:hypothetical protein